MQGLADNLRTCTMPNYVEPIQARFFNDVFQNISGMANLLPLLPENNDDANINLFDEWVKEVYLKLITFDWQIFQNNFFPIRD